MKKIYQYGILSGFLALCACGNNSDNMDASGTFEATEVIVSAEANGKIEQLDIEEGSIVTARQKLGYIDTVQLYLQKEQLLKNIRSVESNRPDINKQIAATRQQIAPNTHPDISPPTAPDKYSAENYSPSASDSCGL